jgi:hypothetical protein
MAHAYFILDTWRYKYTLRLCDTCCFSSATMVAWMRLVLCYIDIACLVVVLYSAFFHHIIILIYSNLRNESYKKSFHQPPAFSHLSSFIAYCLCLWKHLFQFSLLTFFMICTYVCLSLFPFTLLMPFFNLHYMATLLPSSSLFIAYGMTSGLTL